jgi:adenosine deaminase
LLWLAATGSPCPSSAWKRATINSDDPAYFGGYIAENFRAAAASRRLGKAQLVSLARNSFLGAFLDEGTRQSYLRRLDEFARLNVALG